MAKTGSERMRIYRLRQRGLLPPKPKTMTALERNRKYRYGLTPDDYYSMLCKQDGKCAICRCSTHLDKFNVDHNHKTNKARGLLCHRCNLLIGFADDNIELLKSCITYIRQNSN